MKTLSDAMKTVRSLSEEHWVGKYKDFLLDIVKSEETNDLVLKFSRFVIGSVNATAAAGIDPETEALHAKMLLEIALRSAFCQGLIIGVEMEKQDISAKELLSL